jgi:hypothetical protein
MTSAVVPAKQTNRKVRESLMASTALTVLATTRRATVRAGRELETRADFDRDQHY